MYQCTNGNIGLNLPFIPYWIEKELDNRLLPHCKSSIELHLVRGFYFKLISACNGLLKSSYRSIKTYATEFHLSEGLVRRAIKLLTDTGLITCTESPFGKPSRTYQLKPVPFEPKPEPVPLPLPVTEPKPEPEPVRVTEPEPKPVTEPEPKPLSESVLMFKRKPVKISQFEPLLISEPERQIKATCTCGKPTTEFELKRWGVCSDEWKL